MVYFQPWSDGLVSLDLSFTCEESNPILASGTVFKRALEAIV